LLDLNDRELPCDGALQVTSGMDRQVRTVAEEADEAVFWLEFAVQSHVSTAARIDPMLNEARELRAIFAASDAASRRNRRSGNHEINRSSDQQIIRCK